ncbi:protein kinase [candidate division KSB1 bacterium]|nr:protein kinase [candidate division KSB1 bacterium]
MIPKNILHYELLEQLASGSMGVVYKAEDTKLKRTVALKFLPEELTRDEEAVDRFINEAQLASSLDHANICTIYEINETEDGQLFICMAYYEGETLAQKIERGHLLVEQAIDIIGQIAQGLERVHEAGITHRDLKPTNVIITHRGEVRILDFGIAKLAGVSRLTKPGITLGTLAYMSPEQVQKQKVDHRSDIWSLGVVLYEILTGILPFQADCEAAMIYAIVNENPEPIIKFRMDISEGIQRIIGKALDKNPKTRYQQISELLDDLKLEQRGEHELIKPPAKIKSKSSKQKSLIFVGFILVAMLAILFTFATLNKRQREWLPSSHQQITFKGNASKPQVSPYGQFVAYLLGKVGDQRLLVEDLTNGQSIEIFSGINIISAMEWSPNGSELAFSGNFRDIAPGSYVISRLGGTPRRISAAFFFSWSPDGAYIASANGNWKGIHITKTDTDQLATMIPIYGSFHFLNDLKWSPLTDRLLYLSYGDEGSAIWTIKLDGSQEQKIVEDSYKLFSPRWAANGKTIYYFRTVGRIKQLMKVNVSTRTGKAITQPEILQNGLEVGENFALSRDNKKLFYCRELRYSNLWLLNLNNKNFEPFIQPIALTTGTMAYFAPSFSPDCEKLAFSLAKGTNANLFVMPLTGGQMRQLTFMNAYNTSACWSPDGSEIAFGSLHPDGTRVWIIDAAGGNPEPFHNSMLSSFGFEMTWAPGNQILYQRPGHRNFYRIAPHTAKEQPLIQNEAVGWMFAPRYSPGGKRVAISWNMQFEESESGLWSISMSDSSRKLLSKGDYQPIVWSDDGKWIYAWSPLQNSQVFKIAVNGSEIKTVATISANEVDGLTMTPDGEQIVYAAVEIKSDVWLMEKFDPENELERPFEIPVLPEYQQLSYLNDGLNFIRQKKYAEAEQVYRDGLALNSKNSLLLDQLAKRLSVQKKYKEAEQIYRKGLAKEPKNLVFLGRLGFVLLHQLKYDEAEAYFLKGLAQDSVDPTCMYGLTILNIETKNYSAAQSYAEKYLESSSPRNRKNRWLLVAKIYLLQKNYALAELRLKDALDADSSYVAACSELGYFFAIQQHFGRAKAVAQKAVSLDSSFTNQNLLAWVLVAGDIDVERGIAIAEKALDSKPEDWAHTVSVYPYYAVPEHTIGRGYLKKGDYQKAIQYLEQAAQIAPERESIRSDLQRANKFQFQFQLESTSKVDSN